MFADVSALQHELLQKEPADFVSHYIFQPVPFAFSADLAGWIRWKNALALGLEVDPHDIVLTGSAAVGFSLNPYKGYSSFNDGSDIDCGIISPYHFDVAWRYLRKMRPAWLTLPRETKRAIEDHRKNYIFTGTIATDRILAQLPFGIEWQKALDQMGTMAPTIDRDVKLRIYKDFDALRQYQAMNIVNLRTKLFSNEQTEIGLENGE